MTVIEPENDMPRWWQRPSGRIVAEFDLLCVAVIIAILTVPALAEVVIPVPGTNYQINLGDAPPWIAAFVLAATWWEARSARKHAAEAKVTAVAAVATIEVVRTQTDGLLDKVAAMSKSAGKVEGRQEEVAQVAAAKEIARTDAVADAKVAAEVRAAGGKEGGALTSDMGVPIPVIDNKAATVAERVADATERMAEATERAVDPAGKKKGN